MASFFNVTLDTLPPQGLTVTLDGGAAYATSRLVTLALAVEDADTAGYQMKIWGVSDAAEETDAAWETYTASKKITLPDGDGLKTVSVKVRDDVGNETAAAAASITVNTAVPVVSVTGPDRSRLSKISGFDTAALSFMADVDFAAYKVCVVPAASSLEGAGTAIPTDGGSSATSGSDEGGETVRYSAVADGRLSGCVRGAGCAAGSKRPAGRSGYCADRRAPFRITKKYRNG